MTYEGRSKSILSGFGGDGILYFCSGTINWWSFNNKPSISIFFNTQKTQIWDLKGSNSLLFEKTLRMAEHFKGEGLFFVQPLRGQFNRLKINNKFLGKVYFCSAWSKSKIKLYGKSLDQSNNVQCAISHPPPSITMKKSSGCSHFC